LDIGVGKPGKLARLNPCFVLSPEARWAAVLATRMLGAAVVLSWLAITHVGGQLRHIVAKRPMRPKDGVIQNVMLWDDERCEELVGPVFTKIQCPNERLLGAYKADLCRLYVLYKYGGVYTDDDVWLLREPPRSNTSIITVRESSTFKRETKSFYFNAFISVPYRNHPGILNAIALSLKTVKDIPEKFSRGPTLWGPWVLYTALREYNVTELTETCSRTPCDCHVENLLRSHYPCRYR